MNYVFCAVCGKGIDTPDLGFLKNRCEIPDCRNARFCLASAWDDELAAQHEKQYGYKPDSGFYLFDTHKHVIVGGDPGEPEDATLARDLRWVVFFANDPEGWCSR